MVVLSASSVDNIEQDHFADYSNWMNTGPPHPPDELSELGFYSWALHVQGGMVHRNDESTGISPPNTHRKDARAEPYPSMALDFPSSTSRFHYERCFFYATHWEKYCLPALSPVFEQMSTQMEQCPVLGDAILALSACNLSRAHPELKKSDTLCDREHAYRPHLTHHMHSQMYYNSAIRKLARLSVAEYRYNLLSILAAMLLFCYMESSTCNFLGHHCHMKGMSDIFAIDMEKIRTSPGGNELLITWEQLKYYNWWIRIHFSTLHFQRSQSACKSRYIVTA
jgi:hypothetical protein